MYERFYGLSRTPFAVTPDPAMLFMSKGHREALATIIYGVETRKGFIVCTGEVGTGKSTIVRAFFDQAEADVVKLIYIFTPQVSPFEMAQYICSELDIAAPESIFAAVPRLQLKLLELFESGRTVVLMIDEAQLLPPETLEFLRLLSNFETDTEKLIQIVLVGQPEVDSMLARRDMRQVNQRVALRARLAELSVEESYDYIEHRLRVCGAGDLQQVMSQSAAWLIAEAAGGIPRRINILADNALIAGFGAGQRPLGSQLAGAAVNEFLQKSGSAGPVAAQRFAAGWRAARRLRGALAREKGEPAEWVSTAPPERVRPPAIKDSPAAGLRAPASARSADFIAPRPPPTAAATVRPAVPPAARSARVPEIAEAGFHAPPPARPLEPAESSLHAAPPRETPPALIEPQAAIVEPVAQPPEAPKMVPLLVPLMIEPEPIEPDDLFGVPAAIGAIRVFEPVMQSSADPLAGQPAPAAIPNEETPEPPPPTPRGANGSRPADLPNPRLFVTRQTAWPALSRVRAGLQRAERASRRELDRIG